MPYPAFLGVKAALHGIGGHRDTTDGASNCA